MKIIVQHKDRKVLYDEQKKIYIKEFYPTLKTRFKNTFKMREYPGINFNFVSKKLNEIGVKTPKIVEYSKYRVVTSEINGITLEKYFFKKNDESVKIQYLKILIKILNNNIYYRDLGLGNFMYDGKDIFAIDLEGYIIGGILTGRKRELKNRLQKALKNDEWVDYVLKNLN